MPTVTALYCEARERTYIKFPSQYERDDFTIVSGVLVNYD